MLNKLCSIHHALACLLWFLLVIFWKGFLALSFILLEGLWRDDSAKSEIVTIREDCKCFSTSTLVQDLKDDLSSTGAKGCDYEGACAASWKLRAAARPVFRV
jgi:hypothetical protein